MKCFSRFYPYFLFSVLLLAQPKWAIKIPEGYQNDYFAGHGTSAYSKSEAAVNAYRNALLQIINSGVIRISSVQEAEKIVNETMKNGKSDFEETWKSITNLNVEGRARTVANLKEVETYYEPTGNGYEAWVLVSLPKANPTEPPTAFSPVWRSLLLPGWGQLYKDETIKGMTFMALTVGSIAGGIVFHELSVDASNKAYASRTQARRDYYNQDKKDYNTYGIISFIAAGAFYAWSLADAIMVKQENLYVEIDGRGRLTVRFPL